VPAYEVLHVTPAVRSLIRDSKTHQIAGVMAAGGAEGMITKDQSVLALYQAGQITRETALAYVDNPEQLQRRMGS
jgi:twitching motility protein PilT